MKQVIHVDDRYVPRRNAEVEEIELVSKRRPRDYVLVHPQSRRIETLDIRDHFLWSAMDGETSLAALKQAYYDKFKALPTGHITELTRHLLASGFLEGTMEEVIAYKKQSQSFGVFEFSVPVAAMRTILGWILRLFANGLGAIFLAAVGVVLYAWAFSVNGLAYYWSLEKGQLGILTNLIAFLGSFYVISLMRLLAQCASLSVGKTFYGDRLYFGLALGVPFFRLSTGGLLLKVWESRIHAHFLHGTCPLILGGIAAVLPMLSAEFMTEPFLSLLHAFAVAVLVDQVLSFSPFWQSSWVRLLDTYIESSVSVRRLAGNYMKSMRHHLLERPRNDSRTVLVFFALLFLWSVLGGSALMMFTSQLADAVLLDLNNRQVESWIRQAVQLGFYVPIFSAFAFFLITMLQPVFRSIAEDLRWREPVNLAVALTGVAMLASAILISLPSDFSGILAAFVAVYAMKYSVQEIESLPLWLKIHVGVQGAGILLLGLFIIMPQMQWPLWSYCILVLLWHVLAAVQISPRQKTWFAISIPLALLFSAVLCAITWWAGVFTPLLLIIAPAGGISLVLIVVGSRSLGAHFILGLLASLALMSALVACDLGIGIGGALAICAWLCSALQRRGLAASMGHRVHRLSMKLKADMDDPRGAVRDTLYEFVQDCWGDTIAKYFDKTLPKDWSFLNDYRHWLKNWLDMANLQLVMKTVLSGPSWDERGQLFRRFQRIGLENLESASGLTTDQRVAALQAQVFFKSVETESLKDLADTLVPMRYLEGSAVVEEGDDCHGYLELIVEGRLVMSQRGEDGEDHYVAELGAGDSIRLKDLLVNAPYNFTVRAIERVLTLRLYRTHFSQWGGKNEKNYGRVMESIQLADNISNLSLFRDFSAAQMRLLVGRLRRKKVKEGVVVIRQGDEGDDFYLLHQGKVEILVNDKKVAELYSGSYFGEIALIEKCTRTATVKTASLSVLYTLEKADFEHFFAQGRGAQVLRNISTARAEDARAK